MIELLRRGEVDLISETPFSAFFLAAHGGGEIILREWKKGKASYYTVFIARKDSGIDSLADLRGKMIVFEDPGSTSAFLVPFIILREQGFEMVELASPRETPPAGRCSGSCTRRLPPRGVWPLPRATYRNRQCQRKRRCVAGWPWRPSRRRSLPGRLVARLDRLG